MANKKTHASHLTHQRFVVWIGYTLFVLIVIYVIASTVFPLVNAMQYPGAKYFNITVILVTFAVTALVPPLIAYIAGDSATRSKNKELHHYNGVLFGLLAYWVSLAIILLGGELFTSLGKGLSVVGQVVLVNVGPVIIAVAVLCALAWFYHKGPAKKRGVIQYKPYQVTLFASVFAIFVVLPLIQLAQQAEYLYYPFEILVGLLIVFAISYIALRKIKTTMVEKIVFVFIGLTIGFATQSVANQIIPFLTFSHGFTDVLLTWLGIVLSIVTWIAYLQVTAKDLK